MRDWGKIKTAFWTDKKLRPMDSDCKLLFAYLLSGPHTNALGCFYCPDGYIATDLGWTLDRVFQTLLELSRKGFVMVGDDFKWLPNFLSHNVPENQNVWKHVDKLADSLPTTLPFLSKLFNQLDRPPPPSEPNPSETVSEPYRIPEPEPEPEIEPEPKKKEGRKRPPPRKGSRLTENWYIPIEVCNYALDHGFTLDQQVEMANEFVSYYTQGDGMNKSRTELGWRQSWQRWVRKQIEFKKERKNGKEPLDYREGARNVFRRAGFAVGEDSGGDSSSEPDAEGLGKQAGDILGEFTVVGQTHDDGSN